MTIEVKLPEIGDGIDSGDVLDVLVKVGDMVEKDQDILEMETDKATMGVPCTHAGKVVKVHVSEGQTVPVGATLITIEAVTEQSGPQQTAPTAETPPASPPAPASENTSPPVAPPAAIKPSVSKPPASSPATALNDGENVAAGPAVRRFAREVGVDLTHIAGSGEGGRITREDVLQAVRSSGASGPAAETPAAAIASPDKPKEREERTDRENSTPTAGAELTETDKWGPIRVERLSKVRKTIANKMFQSWTTAPRVTNFDDADITELEMIRQASKSDYRKKGVKLTSMPFLIKAVAMALKAHPAINAAIDMEQDQVIYKEYVNVGIAVDTDRGLLVPCMRAPDQMSVADIARSLASIAENVRCNDFSIEDLQGGTFTISNLGAIGGAYSTPIINVPEVAILLAGRARKMPVVVGEEVAIRLMMPLSLSYDHRLVDGATAARFLNEVIEYLQSPSRLLLAP